MPAKSAAQKRLMDAAAHNPAFAKKVGIPSKVAKEFSGASKGLKFGKGGPMKKVFAGKETKAEEAKERKLAGSKAAYQRAEKRYEGESMKTKKMADGGPTAAIMPVARRPMPAQSNAGGAMRGLDRAAAMSGRAMPPAAAAGLARAAAPIAAARMAGGMKKGGGVKKMAAGGLSAGHKSVDGIASKGKTKGKQIAMKKGGKVCK